MKLDNLHILIKTFLRDGFLLDTVRDLRQYFPECKLVIIDDGYRTPAKDLLYEQLNKAGHVALYVPFDSGFGEKSNMAIPHYTLPFVLIASDDFNFSLQTVRYGVENMVRVMEHDKSLGVASGRVNNHPYEGWLIRECDTVTEKAITYDRPLYAGSIPYHLCDLTVNYSVLRTSMLKDGVRWDGGDVKIGGGEHAAFFLDVKERGWKVAHVPGASITEYPYNPAKVRPEYSAMRGRARVPGRPCLKRRGINKYRLFCGQVEIS